MSTSHPTASGKNGHFGRLLAGGAAWSVTFLPALRIALLLQCYPRSIFENAIDLRRLGGYSYHFGGLDAALAHRSFYQLIPRPFKTLIGVKSMLPRGNHSSIQCGYLLIVLTQCILLDRPPSKRDLGTS
jgi:hypothetical protein